MGFYMEHDINRKRKYSFNKYSGLYAMLFVREKKRLILHLGRTMHIEHIGSTAVQGLGGKNILDLMIGDVPLHFKNRIKQLSELGYVFHSENGSKNRLFFVRDTKYNGKRVRIHLHLINIKSKEWAEKLAFRDYLKSNKTAMLKYGVIKRKAALIAKGDKGVYMKEKDVFIRSTIRKALSIKKAVNSH